MQIHFLVRPLRSINAATALGFLFLLATSPVGAQTTPTSQNDPRPALHAVLRSAPVVVDGKLDDAAWAAAELITDFHQQTPDQGKSPSERTELRVLYDSTAIYIGARMYDSQGPAGVRRLLVRRDQLINDNGSDKIALVLDPYHDRQTRVWFELNPLGVKGDHLNGDASFDPVWEGAAHIDSLGWTAEFRIPLSQLHFPRDSVQTWGFQVWRTLARRNEQDMWAFWSLTDAGGPGYFGTIDGLALPAQPKQLELLPYVVSKTNVALADAADPFHKTYQVSERVGGDLKYNLTSNLTLDATVNPDFGQVEVDPAVVNLSAFETTFDEKRPFFVANSSAFSFGSFNCFFCSNTSNMNVFYSRRIGRSPQLAGLVGLVGSEATFADIPDATTILGAGKVTGRTAGGLSVAMLEAVTNRTDARFVAAPNAPVQQAEIEPLTNYFVGRLRQDFRDGDTHVGMIATSTKRFMSDSTEKSLLRSRAELVGADISHYWGKRAYSFNGQLAVSDVGGDTAAMRLTQLSSSHYFQRPDRTETSDGLFNIAYDPKRTSLQGYGAYARLAKETGDWLFETAQNWRSPGFEMNDLGALGRTDYKWMQADMMRQWTEPTSWYRSAVAIAGGQQQIDYEGDRTDLQSEIFGQMTFPNYMSGSAFIINHPPVWDPLRTRGGVVEKTAGYNFISASASGDSRRAINWDASADRGQDITDNGWNGDVNADLIITPRENIRVTFGPAYSRNVDPKAYVTTATDPTATAFGGQRNVFGRLDQHSFSMNTRLNATFTPNLTLELFAQPFLANGHYDQLKQYVAPRTSDVAIYGSGMGTLVETRDVNGHLVSSHIDPDGAGPAAAFDVANPDFSIRSVRGTAVMRWEYRPGSTIFFVWTQERSGSEAFADFDFNRDRAALFRDRPVNVFQIKASYWLGA